MTLQITPSRRVVGVGPVAMTIGRADDQRRGRRVRCAGGQGRSTSSNGCWRGRAAGPAVSSTTKAAAITTACAGEKRRRNRRALGHSRIGGTMPVGQRFPDCTDPAMRSLRVRPCLAPGEGDATIARRL
jgi:hypothetical protein